MLKQFRATNPIQQPSGKKGRSIMKTFLCSPTHSFRSNCWCALFALCALGLALPTLAATLTTDRSAYAPGETVLLSGAGFAANDAVTVQVIHVGDGDNSTSPAHQPWSVSAGANGSFQTTWIVPLDEDELGATLLATATGAS